MTAGHGVCGRSAVRFAAQRAQPGAQSRRRVRLGRIVAGPLARQAESERVAPRQVSSLLRFCRRPLGRATSAGQPVARGIEGRLRRRWRRINQRKHEASQRHGCVPSEPTSPRLAPASGVCRRRAGVRPHRRDQPPGPDLPDAHLSEIGVAVAKSVADGEVSRTLGRDGPSPDRISISEVINAGEPVDPEPMAPGTDWIRPGVGPIT